MGARSFARRFALFIAIAAGLGALARDGIAAVPCPSCSSVDPVLVGSPEAGSPLPAFTVIVRHTTGAPLPNREVALRFTDPALALVEEQEPGTEVLCGLRMIKRWTGPDGSVGFRARFGGYSNAAELEVLADGVLLARVMARSTDLNADGATTLSDLGLFAAALADPYGSPETDFDLNGITGLGDLALLGDALSAPPGGSPCP